MKPILFNTKMVRAILDGSKTVTRRAIKPKYHGSLEVHDDIAGVPRLCEKCGTLCRGLKPPYESNEILYVRETWGDYRECSLSGEDGFYYLYRADYPDGARCVPLSESERTDYADSYDLPRWHPSIHMPKEAARIFLRVTDVSVEQLQNMAYFDFLKEGLPYDQFEEKLEEQFKALWDSTIKPANRNSCGWDANPWVWVIEFERCKEPKEEK